MGWDGREGGEVLGGGMWSLLKSYEVEVVASGARGGLILAASVSTSKSP